MTSPTAPDPAREAARRPDGRFGEQPKADAGQLDLAAAEWVQDGVTPHPTGGYVRVENMSSGGTCYQNARRLHREDGPALIWPSGHQEWWQDGRRHREDGPAVVLPDGGQQWRLHGQLHRTDGPAVTHADGREECWVHGEQVDPPDPD